MSDQFPAPTPIPARPTIAGAGPDPQRPVFHADPPAPATRSDGGFRTGILVAIVFVVVAIIAAAVFSKRDLFGIGLGVTPVSAPVKSAPVDSTIAPPVLPQPPVTNP